MTSAEGYGQIYVGAVSWLPMIATLERAARVACHDSLQSARAWPCRMLEIQSGVPEIYRRARRPALLLGRVLINGAC
jgi:hypothetical protein